MTDKMPFTALLPVDEAVARILEGASPAGDPARVEHVPIGEAAGRVVAEDLPAKRTQPPVDVSAMDGYALRAADAAEPGADLAVVGISAAGHGFRSAVGPGEAVRIFTGAPMPAGTDSVLLQEDASRDGDRVHATIAVTRGRHVRSAGFDFTAGAPGLARGSRLDFRRIALAAAMNYAEVPVYRRPRVAILSTGDELVPPGTEPGPDQIVASNDIGIAALVAEAGGAPERLGIAPDDLAILGATIAAALDGGVDLLVTLGGASVGDHDLVRAALAAAGADLDFWRIAMRPGKPLMAGRRGRTRILGLPGNPVSSLVCGLLFVAPLVRALAGEPAAPIDEQPAVLGTAMAPNDGRRDYVRAGLERRRGQAPVATPLPVQDSSMITALAGAGCLILREPGAPAAAAGDPCRIIAF